MRTRNKIQIFTFILLITVINDLPVYGGSISGSDNHANDCEMIFVHLDKTIYVAGENINYKVYVINGKSPLIIPESKILYFSLSEHKSGKQISWRINLDKNALHGSFQLPENMNPGIWQLAAYTNRIRENLTENIFSKELLILNLARETPDSVYIPVPNAVTGSKTGKVNDEQPNLRLEASKPVYSTNDKVALEITVDNLHFNDTAYLSLSVTNELPIRGILHNTSIIEQFNRFGENIDEPCLNGLENYAYIIDGRVLNKKNGLPVENAKIFLAVVDSVSPKIMYTAADSDGNFRLYLNQSYDNMEIILQLADNTGNLDILWDIQQKGIPYTGGSDVSVPLSAEQVAFLNQTKDIRLIEALYSERMISKKATRSIPGVGYFACPDIIIFPSDYTEMANFREITDNIIPQIRLRNRKDNYYLEVYNDSKGALSENNLVLLNGVPFSDINYIATLGTRDIKKIEIINSGSFIAGDIRYNAVISVYTHNVRLPESYLKAYTMIFLNTVTGTGELNESDEYGIPVHTRKHFPDFRNNLYWNPELKVSGNNTIAVGFTTSQLEGEYHAVIQGITSSGIPLATSISFSVK